jgi:hypothetical protein
VGVRRTCVGVSLSVSARTMASSAAHRYPPSVDTWWRTARGPSHSMVSRPRRWMHERLFVSRSSALALSAACQ